MDRDDAKRRFGEHFATLATEHIARRLAEARAEVIDAIEETFLGQLPSKALSYCAQEDVNAGLDALREQFGLDGDGR